MTDSPEVYFSQDFAPVGLGEADVDDGGDVEEDVSAGSTADESTDEGSVLDEATADDSATDDSPVEQGAAGTDSVIDGDGAQGLGFAGVGGGAVALVGSVGSPTVYVGPNIRSRSLSTTPGARAFQGSALDTARNEVVIFGGVSDTGVTLSSTWTWNGYTWTQESPATSPPARSSAVMVWDDARDEVVLFGGLDSSGNVLGDTWVWNGTTWTQKFPATSPSARRDAAATFVGGAISQVTVFGGKTASTVLNDTWRWTGSNWQSVSTTGSPAARWQSSMAYSPVLDQTILFGGESATSGTLLDDTWVLSGSTWTAQSPSAHSSAMKNHVLVYNPALSVVQIFGGRDASSYADVAWGWSSGNWVQFEQQSGLMTGTAGAVVQAPAASGSNIATGQLLFEGGLRSTTGVAYTGVFSYDWSPYGLRPEYDTTSFTLSDQTSVWYNHANSNLGIISSDITLAGVSGPLSIVRYYNRAGRAMDSDLSQGWSFNTGNDLHLGDLPDGDKLLFNENGSLLWFDYTGSGWTTPPGIDATLATVSGGIELTYHGSDRVLRFVSNKLVSDTDRDGNAVTFTYTGSGKTSVITDTMGRTLTFGYNGIGKVSTITESTGRVWSYGYDANNQLTTFTNAENETTTYTFTNVSGELFPTTITTPDTQQVNLGYPSSTQLTFSWVHSGGPRTYTFTRNSTNVAGATSSTTVTDPLSHNRITVDDWWSRIAQTTDANGHMRSTTWNGQSSPLTLQGNAVSSVYTFVYNLNNRLSTGTAPASGSGITAAQSANFYGNTSFPYQPSSGTDEQGNCAAYQYNATGNLSQINTGVTPGGSTGCDNATTGSETTILREGDPTSGGSVTCGGKQGQVCETIDPNGNSTTYAYDSVGNLTDIYPPSLGSTNIVYDAESRPTMVTDGAGRVTRVFYDNQDRITKIQYNNTTTCNTATVNCIRFNWTDVGQLYQRITNEGTTTYIYDAAHRLIRKTLPGAVPNACSGFAYMRFTYDDADNLLTYCDAQGTVTYGYDNANQLTSVQEPGGNCVANTGPCTKFTYTTSGGAFYEGRPVKITYPTSTGVTTTYGYNNANMLTSIYTIKSGSGTPLQDVVYNYVQGTNDRMLKQSQTSPTGTEPNRYYRYDTFNQLCWAAPATSANNCVTRPTSAWQYTYDANGNRTGESTTAGAFTNYAFDLDNQLCDRETSGPASCSSPNYTYDSTGNRLTGPTGVGPTWTYGTRNQAVTYTPPSASTVNISYHDTDSTEQAAIGTTGFAYSPLGLAVDTTTTRTTAYTRTPTGRPISQRVGVNASYYITDDLGSVINTFNSSGTIQRTYRYDPIGRTTTATGSGDDSYYRFASGYVIPGTTILKMGTRYYDPNNSGTWTQPDPSGQEANPYTYAGANPANYTDPSGYLFGIDLPDIDLDPFEITSTALGVLAVASGNPLFGVLAIGVSTLGAGIECGPKAAAATASVGLLGGLVGGAFEAGKAPLAAAITGSATEGASQIIC